MGSQSRSLTCVDSFSRKPTILHGAGVFQPQHLTEYSVCGVCVCVSCTRGRCRRCAVSMQRDWLMTMSRLRAVLLRPVLLRPVLRCTDCVSSLIDTRHRSPPTRSDVSLTCSPASTTDASTNTGTPPRAGTGSLELTPPFSKSGMCSRSRGLGLETVSRTNNVSSRSRLGQSAQRLGLGLFHVVGRDVLCCVRAVWHSIVVVVPYRPICLSP